MAKKIIVKKPAKKTVKKSAVKSRKKPILPYRSSNHTADGMAK